MYNFIKSKILILILVISSIWSNPFPVDSAVNFIHSTNDINQNGIPDVLTFEGKAIVKNVEIFDVDNNNNLSSFWSYTLPDSLIGYFIDGTILSHDNKSSLVLMASLKNSTKTFFLFDIINGNISKDPNKVIGLPLEYAHFKNPQQITLIDWNNDGNNEMAISFSGLFRSVLICDLNNNQISILDRIAEDFLSITFSPILIGSGDLNGDKKDDLIIVDNGRKANSRIYLNGMTKNGLRILGLKDLGQLSFLNKNGVNFDGLGGDEMFFASKNSGLHYLFVESIGRVNQAVTVKTQLLVESINKIYIAENASSNQIVTITPEGMLGRYEIIKDNNELNIGVFENKKIDFSVMRPNKISSIYFSKYNQLVISAYNDIQSEIYFYKHKPFIEPAIDYSLQREDSRIPDIVISVNDSANINIPWVDSLRFLEFSSKSLLDGMSFNANSRSLSWIPNVNQLGFNEIFYDISFKGSGNFNSIEEDTLTKIVLNETIVSSKDSILIYVNDFPSLQENRSVFNVIGDDDFVQKFSYIDRNVDSKHTFYFLNDSLNGISVDDSGYVRWKIPNFVSKQKDFDLCINDGISKDTLKIQFNIHPKIDFNIEDSIFIAHLGKPFSLSFFPDTSYKFNSYKYSIPNAPSNMFIDNNGLFSWEPSPSQINLNTFFISISDDKTESKQSISIYVNSPPVISSSPPDFFHLLNNTNFEFRFDSYDANPDASFAWNLTSGPKGMNIQQSGTISWVPDKLDFVPYSVQLSDGYDSTSYNGQLYINSAPQIVSSPVDKINLGDTLFYKVEIKDDNNLSFMDPLKENVISFNLLSSPSSAKFNDNILTWIPTDDDIGNNNFDFFISDGLERDSQNFSVFVNDIPTIFNIDTIFVEIDKPLNHKILINDLNNKDIIDIDLINNDLGVLIANDTLKWLPDSSFIGNHLLKIRVTDSHINFDNDFDIVLSVFSKPVFLNSPPKDAYVGLEYIYEPKVNFFSLNNEDLELIESSSDQIKLTNNKLIWTPSLDDAKNDIHKVVLKASGDKNRSTSMEFFIKVYQNPKIK